MSEYNSIEYSDKHILNSCRQKWFCCVIVKNYTVMFYKLVIYEMHILHDRCLQFTFDLDKGYFPPERAYNYNIPEVYFNILRLMRVSLDRKFLLTKKKKFALTSCINFFIKSFFCFWKFKKKKVWPHWSPRGEIKKSLGWSKIFFFEAHVFR